VKSIWLSVGEIWLFYTTIVNPGSSFGLLVRTHDLREVGHGFEPNKSQ